MKSTIKALTFLLLTVCVTPVYSQAIKIDDNGKVGIGGLPEGSYALKVNGNMKVSSSLYALNLTATSSLSASQLNIGTIYANSGHLDILGNIGIRSSYASDATLKISSEGNAYAIKVEGEAMLNGGVWESSDGKLKKNILNIDKKSMLDKVIQLQSKSYYFKDRDELKALHDQGLAHFATDTVTTIDPETGLETKKVRLQIPHFTKKKQYGLIAEEVEQIFPELVMTDSLTTLKAINYTKLIPILIEAIKEQEEKIVALENIVNGQ